MTARKRRKGRQRPSTARTGDLLDACPSDPFEVPEWILSLSAHQADRIWVAAVVELLAEGDDVTVRQIARILNAVRTVYRDAAGGRGKLPRT